MPKGIKTKRRCGTYKRDRAETAFLLQDDIDESEHFFDIEHAIRTHVHRPIVASSSTTTLRADPQSASRANLETSCGRVFGIVELAEQILLALHPTDILCGAQQACRQWRDVVKQSSSIQELLFFKPIPAKALRYSNAARGMSIALDSTAFTTELIVGEGLLPVVENPYLFMLSVPECNCASRPMDASWRRMLISQPPPVFLTVHRANRLGREIVPSRGERARRGCIGRGPPPVVLGDLGDCLQVIETQGSWRSFQDWEQITELKRWATRRIDERILGERLNERFVELEVA